MTVPEQIPVVNYVADGVVKKFDVPFEYDQQSDLHIYVDGAEPTIDKYFFEDNAFNFYIAPNAGQDVKIKRITPKERDTDYNLHTNTVRPKALNSDFDRIWYVLQEVLSDVDGLSQDVQDEIIARIQGDEDVLNQLAAEISARMLADESVSADLKNYIDNMIALIIGDPSFNGINADKVNDDSGKTQQQVNDSVKEQLFTFLTFGAKGDGVTDDTTSLRLAAIYSSTYKRPVSGLGKTYVCADVVFDSNCYLKDAYLVNNRDEDLISVLTTATSRVWIEQVTFENIHIDGKRVNARTVELTTAAEDGGRHGFRFRRPCRNIWIINSSANYCASDGVCIFPDWSDGGLVESVQNFNIINSQFNWNRRHGGSNDRTNGLHLNNVQCNHNGLYLEGGESLPLSDGRQGDKAFDLYYGNGWDSEEYVGTTMSFNMNFINCTMLGNAKGGLLVLATDDAVTPLAPTNIKVIGGQYDKGVLNPTDNNAITITANGLSNPNKLFSNTVIDGVSTTNNILLRNNGKFSVTNTPCTLFAVEQTDGFADAKISGLVESPTSSTKTIDGNAFGLFSYDKPSGVQTVSSALNRIVNMYEDATSKHQDFKISSFKFGEIETTVDSSTDSTTWKWKVGGSNAERFRVGRYGAQLQLSASIPDSELLNTGLAFEFVSNTSLKIKLKGTDGVVRSANLTLA